MYVYKHCHGITHALRILYGAAPPGPLTTLTLLYTKFHQKGTPFIYFCRKATPFYTKFINSHSFIIIINVIMVKSIMVIINNTHHYSTKSTLSHMYIVTMIICEHEDIMHVIEKN